VSSWIALAVVVNNAASFENRNSQQLPGKTVGALRWPEVINIMRPL
jgi:hypothetical protein